MKTKLKHLSKSSISVLLALMMIVSTVTVGIITTSAAYVDDGSKVGDSIYGMNFASIVGSMSDWTNGIAMDKKDDNHYSKTIQLDANSTYEFKIKAGHTDNNWADLYSINGDNTKYQFHSSWSGPATDLTTGKNNFELVTMNATSGKVNVTFDFYGKYGTENKSRLTVSQEAVVSSTYYMHWGTTDNNKDNWTNHQALSSSVDYEFNASANQFYSFCINTNSNSIGSSGDCESGVTINATPAANNSPWADSTPVWDDGLASGYPGCKFKVSSAQTVKIRYDHSTKTLTMSISSNQVEYGVLSGQSSYGSVTAKIGDNSIGSSPASVATGSSVVFNATPKFGYHFEGWYTDAACTAGKVTTNPLTVTVNADVTRYAKFEANTFDTFYLGGRMAVATSAININANTTGAVKDGKYDGYGIDKTTNVAGPDAGAGANYWTFNETSTYLPFTSQGGDIYKLETHRTISQLSETHSDYGGTTGHNPFYFVIHDNRVRFGGTGNSGANFEGNTESSKLEISQYTGSVKTANEIVFSQFENESDGQVVIWIDASNYNTSTKEGTLKIWYTLDQESNPIASSVKLSATPEKVKKGEKVTLTAVATPTSPLTASDLRYTFYRTTSTATLVKDSEWTQIGTANSSSNKLEYTENSTTGEIQYKVVVSLASGVSGSYYKRSAKTSTEVYQPGIYVTEDHISDTNNVTWTSDLTADYVTSYTNPYKITTGDSYTNSNPYVLAISSTGTWDDDITPLNIASDLCECCTITYGTVTVGELVSTTYVVKPNANCKNPTIYIDFRDGEYKIWAVASFNGPTKTKTTDSTETVTYYFAERITDASKSNCKDSHTGISGDEGMRIQYWNNSNPDKKDETDVYTKFVPNGKSDNTIYVWTNALFHESPTTLNTIQSCYIYKVELPIWATSFRFVDGSNNKFNAVPTNTANQYINDHSITLNPNRVYLLFDNGTGDNWRVKGVVLDESLWDSTRSSTTANEVSTRKFDTNIINYTDIEKLTNPYKPNGALSTMYTNTPNALYFGYFDSGYNSWTNKLTGFNNNNKDWAKNLAQRGNDAAYYASVWDLVGPTLSKTKFNNNGDGSSFGYLLDTQSLNTTTGLAGAEAHPVFDYDGLATAQESGGDHYATSMIAQGKKFPFYESSVNGITTFSYDSTTDRNRIYSGTAATGNFAIQDTVSTVKIKDNESDTYSSKGYAKGFEVGKDSSANSRYTGFFPFGGNDNSYSNTGFGVEFDMNFYMTNTGYLTDKDGTPHDIAFNFSGDDDVWVYIDGVKVLDLGGDHKVSAATINLTDKKVYYKSSAVSIDSTEISNGGTDGSWAYKNNNYINTVDLGEIMAAYGKDFDPTKSSVKHTFQMFYMERGAFQSNCVISFNLPQASGLNIKNTISANSVNPALKTIALHSANPDNFNYYIESKYATGSSSPVTGGRAPSSTFTPILTTPKFPYNQLATRKYSDGVYPDISYILSNTSGANNLESDSLSFGSSNWTRITNTVYSLSDDWLVAEAGKELVTGRTETLANNGIFHLLGSQKANFDNKIPMHSYVRVVQTQDLGTVDTTQNPVTYKALTNNNVANYYTTTYSVYDEKAKKYIVGGGQGNTVANDLTINSDGKFTNVYKADDSRTNDNGFYFSNYSDDTDDVNAAMTVEFDNDIAVGTIRVGKQLTDGSSSKATFHFTLKFARVFGDTNDSDFTEYEGLEYYIYSSTGQLLSTTPRKYTTQNGIAIKADQYAEIRGIPVETRFEVEERSTAGYSFKSLSKEAVKSNGVIVTTSDGNDTYNYSETVTDSTKTTSSKTLWTDTDGFVYYTNMIPAVSETFIGNNAGDNISVSTVDYTNEKETFTVVFKYYDRDTTNGQPASISSKEKEYSKKWDDIDTYVVYKGDSNAPKFSYLVGYEGIEDEKFLCIDFESIVKDSATEFVEATGTGISNLIDDYRMWTTQTKAVTGIKSMTNLHDKGGAKYSGDNCQYHATRNGELNTSGEKWVNYYTVNGTAVNAEANTASSFSAGRINDFDSVKRIEVWLFNQPKEYTVNIYGAATESELNTASDIQVAMGNEKLASGITFENARVAKVNKHSDTFYYSQRLGQNLGDPDYYDKLAYLSAYGITAVKNVMPPLYSSYNISGSEKNYKFAYWAYDAAGTLVASTEYGYANRVTGNFDLYAVYVPDTNPSLELGNKNNNKFGLTITQDADDVFVVDKLVNGENVATPKVRINVMFTPYNLDDYDENIKDAALVNIYTTKLIKYYNDNGITDPEVIKSNILKLHSEYKNQLRAMLASRSFTKLSVDSLNSTSFSPAIELTTKGYVYATSGTGASVVPLTNKNRMQLTTEFTKSNLYADGVTTGILQIGAMLYDDTWVLSDNCVYRTFSKS